jgi:glycerol-3-phosphate acyltransferase PlsY
MRGENGNELRGRLELQFPILNLLSFQRKLLSDRGLQFCSERTLCKMRFLCVLIGYLCGCFLTAEVVARHKTGKSACEIGSKNPGTANITVLFGLKWGAVTLFGDILKTALPCMLCRYVLFPPLGRVAVLYAGTGAALGHGFPFWNRFRGGKSVAVTCTYLVLFSPLWGILANVAGLCIRLVTKYPAIGALAIPSLYLIPLFQMSEAEAGCIVLAGTALMFVLHRDSLRRIVQKTEKKTDLIAKFKKL